MNTNKPLDPPFQAAYVGRRDDIIRLLPPEARCFLDVGCSTGTLGRQIKEARPGAAVYGIEYDSAMAREALPVLDGVVVGDAASVPLAWSGTTPAFDVLIFADVLEHLVNPWSTLRRLAALLQPGGWVVASIPNIRHWSVAARLFFLGDWPYEDEGLHDRTHLRHFTLRSSRALLEQAGLEVVRVERNCRFFPRYSRLNRFARYLAWPGVREWITYQHLLVARKRGAAL